MGDQGLAAAGGDAQVMPSTSARANAGLPAWVMPTVRGLALSLGAAAAVAGGFGMVVTKLFGKAEPSSVAAFALGMLAILFAIRFPHADRRRNVPAAGAVGAALGAAVVELGFLYALVAGIAAHDRSAAYGDSVGAAVDGGLAVAAALTACVVAVLRWRGRLPSPLAPLAAPRETRRVGVGLRSLLSLTTLVAIQPGVLFVVAGAAWASSGTGRDVWAGTVFAFIGLAEIAVVLAWRQANLRKLAAPKPRLGWLWLGNLAMAAATVWILVVGAIATAVVVDIAGGSSLDTPMGGGLDPTGNRTAGPKGAPTGALAPLAGSSNGTASGAFTHFAKTIQGFFSSAAGILVSFTSLVGAIVTARAATGKLFGRKKGGDDGKTILVVVKCPHCGNFCGEHDLFCKQCGHPLGPTPAPPPAAP
jgi:hypothetical protein